MADTPGSQKSVINKSILAILEPTIALDELIIPDFETDKKTFNNVSAFIGSFVPYIVINGYEFSVNNLLDFNYSNNSFLPTIRLTLLDSTHYFLDRHYPLDGYVISMYLKSNNEDIFKSVRIDFTLLKIIPLTDTSEIIVYGQMNVPNLYSEYCISYKEKSSFNVFKEVSKKLQIGFASNENLTKDVMTWINAYDTNYKFIFDVLANSYLDDKSFFYMFIDSYYYLNFVNVNKIYSTIDKTHIEDSELYSNRPIDLDNTLKGKASKAPLLLTNILEFKGTSKYIISFKLQNNSSIVSLANGYKRYIQKYNCKTNLIDNNIIQPFMSDDANLIKLAGRYIGKDDNRRIDPSVKEHNKYKYLGKQINIKDNGNVHENFMYSSMLNYQNSQEMGKMILEIELESMDLSLYRFQVVPVFIVSYDVQKRNTVNEHGKMKIN